VRRHARVECENDPPPSPLAKGGWRGVIRLDGLPDRVQLRELSFVLTGAGTPESTVVTVDGARVPCVPTRPGALCFTVPARDGMRISVELRSPQ
jgi:hypothetical protein